MKRLLIFSLLFCFLLPNLNGQSKRFLAAMDRSEVKENPYISNHNFESFRKSGVATVEMDVCDLDLDLLNAAVFFEFNQLRHKKGRAVLTYNANLDKVARNYVHLFSGNRFRVRGQRARFLSLVHPAAKEMGYHGRLLSAAYAGPVMLDFKGNNYYRDKMETEVSHQLFKGRKPDSREEVHEDEKIPLKAHTYQSFAAQLAAEWFRSVEGKDSRSRAYQNMACYVEPDPRTIKRSQLPRAKAVIVLGGYRMALVQK